MARKGPRGLRPDEEELWSRIARTATPRHPPQPEPAPKEPPEPPRRTPRRESDLRAFDLGSAARSEPAGHDVLPGISERMAQEPLRMDAKAFQKLKRGRMAVEGRIDLHGLTLSEAQPRLITFVLSAHAQGKRLLLVITGKGRDRDVDWPMPVQRGVLKHQVPRWLRTGPTAPYVLQVAEAHRKHGGTGAYYVYLRRAGK